MQNYETLGERIKMFEAELQKRKQVRLQALSKRTQILAELQEDYQQRSNTIISKMDELKRKETLLITLKKIEPEVPQDFPKNYFCQLVYEDTLLTGSQKFTDFDQNIVEEKFVVPLLFSSVVKVEVWSAQEEPVLFSRAQIDLQKDIESALLGEACQGSLQLGSQTTLTYRLQLQGLGFATWLKNIVEVKELQTEKAYSREQAALRKKEMKSKVQQKKQKFREKFKRDNKSTTHEYNSEGLTELISDLQID